MHVIPWIVARYTRASIHVEVVVGGAAGAVGGCVEASGAVGVADATGGGTRWEEVPSGTLSAGGGCRSITYVTVDYATTHICWSQR